MLEESREAGQEQGSNLHFRLVSPVLSGIGCALACSDPNADASVILLFLPAVTAVHRISPLI